MAKDKDRDAKREGQEMSKCAKRTVMWMDENVDDLSREEAIDALKTVMALIERGEAKRTSLHDMRVGFEMARDAMRAAA